MNDHKGCKEDTYRSKDRWSHGEAGCTIECKIVQREKMAKYQVKMSKNYPKKELISKIRPKISNMFLFFFLFLVSWFSIEFPFAQFHDEILPVISMASMNF